MKTHKEILSKISIEGIGTLGVMLKEEPNKFRFSITEVYACMSEVETQTKEEIFEFCIWTHVADLWFVEETKHWNLLEEGSEEKIFDTTQELFKYWKKINK